MGTDSQSRGGICMYCGYTLKAKSLDRKDIALVYEQLIAHDKQCPKNPLVKRVAELEVENKRLIEKVVQLETQLIGGSENDSCFIEGIEQVLKGD